MAGETLLFKGLVNHWAGGLDVGLDVFKVCDLVGETLLLESSDDHGGCDLDVGYDLVHETDLLGWHLIYTSLWCQSFKPFWGLRKIDLSYLNYF